MSYNDWAPDIKIGSKTRGGQTAQERERVLRTKSDINAAHRSGNIAAEKKFGAVNKVFFGFI